MASRPHAPSARRLAEAAARGDHGHSAWLASAVVLVALSSWAVTCIPRVLTALARVMSTSFAAAAAPFDATDDVAAAHAALLSELWVPLLAVPVVLWLVGGAQTGFGLRARHGRTTARRPWSARLSEWFSTRAWGALAYRSAALLLLAAVLCLLVLVSLRGLLALSAGDVTHLSRSLTRFLAFVPGWAAGAMCVLAVGDLLVQRQLRHHALRMTDAELREEHRAQFGDPAAAAERRQRGRQASHALTLSELSGARLVVFAGGRVLVLHGAGVPSVAAHAAGVEGQRLRLAARAADVPCVHDENLVAQLWPLTVGTPVPRAAFAALAPHLAATEAPA